MRNEEISVLHEIFSITALNLVIELVSLRRSRCVQIFL